MELSSLNPLLIFPFLGLFASIVFAPQTILILLGSSLVALFSRQVSFPKIFLGNLLVVFGVGYLFLGPLMFF